MPIRSLNVVWSEVECPAEVKQRLEVRSRELFATGHFLFIPERQVGEAGEREQGKMETEIWIDRNGHYLNIMNLNQNFFSVHWCPLTDLSNLGEVTPSEFRVRFPVDEHLATSTSTAPEGEYGMCLNTWQLQGNFLAVNKYKLINLNYKIYFQFATE